MLISSKPVEMLEDWGDVLPGAGVSENRAAAIWMYCNFFVDEWREDQRERCCSNEDQK